MYLKRCDKGFVAVSYTHLNNSGVMISGLMNVTGNMASGFQFSGVSNITGQSFNGMMTSGLLNVVGENMNGLQIAGIANITAKDLNGAQIGLCNYATKAHGFQIGLVNYYREDMKGLQPVSYTHLGSRRRTHRGTRRPVRTYVP